ncbi:MAG: glycosyltransferase [Kaiparowitsia implicata GSE-PSE-MK54-09C]|jgi:glycosyltransferase involved in cell wall biosynthesis|nr:glycosyltransferase [Kaiparowitsia implicata GSE-PSE-MK54-09C]
MTVPTVSVIICTHNRADCLDAAIASVLQQVFEADYEVIVVNNASTDHTESVLQAYDDSRLRYLIEPTLGLSVARNTGAAAARGDILAYLDDDAIAPPTWLHSLYEAFQSHDQMAIAGGKIILQWATSSRPPQWLSPTLASSLGAYDLGDAPVWIEQPGQTPRGANYALRRQVWQHNGGFNSTLGRIGETLLSNEETLMTEQALLAGWQVGYFPTAWVWHRVTEARLSHAWFLNRSWWQGISDYQRERLTGLSRQRQFVRGVERLLRGVYYALRDICNPAQRFDHLLYAYGQLGYLSQVALQGVPRIVLRQPASNVVS